MQWKFIVNEYEKNLASRQCHRLRSSVSFSYNTVLSLELWRANFANYLCDTMQDKSLQHIFTLDIRVTTLRTATGTALFVPSGLEGGNI